MDSRVKNQGDVIVVNRMYVGDYLISNLGHEVINMFQADNGGYYLYLNAYGSFAKKWQGKIKHMLMTKYHSKNGVEVIGKAVSLSDIFDYEKDESNRRENNDISDNQKEDESNSRESNVISKHQKEVIEGINYCGIKLLKLFSDSERQNVYVTFSADKIYRVKNGFRIFVHYQPQNDDKDVDSGKVDVDDEKNKHIYLEHNKMALASLSQYFENSNEDYAKINELFKPGNNDFWEEVGKVVKPDGFNIHKPSLFDICQIQNDENRLSNVLAYFMEIADYREMWMTFFSDKCDINLDKNYRVAREQATTIGNDNKGRIDLLISDKNVALAIENKIKSGINRKSSDNFDENQLDRYLKYLKATKKDYLLVVLVPEYNKSEIQKKCCTRKTVIVMSYNDLYEFLTENVSVFANDSNFVAFFETIKRHTYNTEKEYLYDEMLQRFFSRIKDVKKVK